MGFGDEPTCDDGDHRSPDVPGKEVRGAVVHDVEPAVAAEPGEQPLDDPPDPVRQEAPVGRAAGRDRDMDVLLECCRGEGCSLEAAVTEQITLEAERGEPRQHRQDAYAI